MFWKRKIIPTKGTKSVTKNTWVQKVMSQWSTGLCTRKDWCTLNRTKRISGSLLCLVRINVHQSLLMDSLTIPIQLLTNSDYAQRCLTSVICIIGTGAFSVIRLLTTYALHYNVHFKMNSHYFFKIFFKPENEPNKWLKDLYSERNFCRSFIKQPQGPRIKIDPKNHLFK